jgi:hypothetical protein
VHPVQQPFLSRQRCPNQPPAANRSYRVVPTEPVDAAWHVSLQHTEPYAAACQQIAGGFVHHVPILTEGMADGSSMKYTRQALKATGYYIDPEFWDGEAKSCCPPNPGI